MNLSNGKRYLINLKSPILCRDLKKYSYIVGYCYLKWLGENPFSSVSKEKYKDIFVVVREDPKDNNSPNKISISISNILSIQGYDDKEGSEDIYFVR